MDINEAILSRHSVRQYLDKEIDEDVVLKLNNYIAQCNMESGLNMQLVLNEGKAFNCYMAHYGKFTNVKNYIALVGKKGKNLYEKVGYYGEKVVLYAQMLGLNTCWVALTYKKINSAIKVNKGEKLTMVIAIGYGENQGKERSSKKPEQVFNISENTPLNLYNGVKMALLAPTAMNQQKFHFTINGNMVKLTAGKGFYTKTDSGIVKLHFEIGAGKESFKWQSNK